MAFAPATIMLSGTPHRGRDQPPSHVCAGQSVEGVGHVRIYEQLLGSLKKSYVPICPICVLRHGMKCPICTLPIEPFAPAFASAIGQCSRCQPNTPAKPGRRAGPLGPW